MKAVRGERRADRLLRALLDESGEPLLALDENGTIVETNAAAALSLRRSRAHLRGEPLASLLSPPGRRALQRALSSLRNGEREALEVRLEEDARPVGLSLRVVPGVTPRSLSVRISDPGAGASAGLRPPVKPRLERVFTRFPLGVLAVHPDLRVAFANSGARRLLGREACRPGARLTPSLVPEPLHAFVERLAAGRLPVRTRPLELPDGRTLHVSAVPPLHDEPALLLLEDVTAAARHEQVMREFVRNAAHQLRTPLTAIAGALEVLQSGAKNDPDALDRFLGHATEHIARMSRATHGLLVLARAQSGEQGPQLELVELRPLLERLTAAAPGVEVELRCSPTLAALAEPELVEEALLALLENAAKHARHGRVRLAAHEEDRQAVIEVADDGPGIPPEHRARIFEPFYRVDGGRDGVGLGLAIAAQAVRAMDGDLSFDGVAGGGTAFRVRLPSARIAR